MNLAISETNRWYKGIGCSKIFDLCSWRSHLPLPVRRSLFHTLLKAQNNGISVDWYLGNTALVLAGRFTGELEHLQMFWLTSRTIWRILKVFGSYSFLWFVITLRSVTSSIHDGSLVNIPSKPLKCGPRMRSKRSKGNVG